MRASGGERWANYYDSRTMMLENHNAYRLERMEREMAENSLVLRALVEMMEEKGVTREELARRTRDGFFRGWRFDSAEGAE